MPVDAFYEWLLTEAGKQPFAIARQDCQPMAFADLWESFCLPGGAITRSFAIATTNANPDVAVHDHMPVILGPGDWPTWLGEANGNPELLLQPSSEGALRAWPVSRRVNTPRNNMADLLQPIQPDAPG